MLRSSLHAMSELMRARPTRRPSRRALLLISIGVAATALIAACGTSGRALPDPAPGATAPPRKTTSSTVANQVTVGSDAAVLRPTGFSLTSLAWSKGGVIPADFGCRGANTSPPLTIIGVPSGTAELLLVATESAAPTAPRWIVAGIAPSTTGFEQGSVPAGAIEVVNSTGSARWSGPCPDTATSTFELRLYALSKASGLTAASGPAAIQPILATATQAAVLRGTSSN